MIYNQYLHFFKREIIFTISKSKSFCRLEQQEKEEKKKKEKKEKKEERENREEKKKQEKEKEEVKEDKWANSLSLVMEDHFQEIARPQTIDCFPSKSLGIHFTLYPQHISHQIQPTKNTIIHANTNPPTPSPYTHKETQ